MLTELLDTSAEAIARAAACLRAGGLVAFPTETVYGLGAHALDAAAVRRLFAAKGRPPHDPLIVHVSSLERVGDLVRADRPHHETVALLAARFWPGPLTLVLPKSDRVPPEVTAGLDTVALRVPAHPVARALLDAAAIPIAAPSANLFSRPSPTRAEHVRQDLDGRIDMLIDGGATNVGVESTVLDLTSSMPTVLRPGAVTLEALRDVLPDVRVMSHARADLKVGPYEGKTDTDTDRTVGADLQVGPQPSPGMMSKHYSPRAPLTLFSGSPDATLDALVARAAQAAAAGRRIGVLAAREDVDAFGDFPVQLAEIGTSDDPAGIAARLYAALRQLDAAGVDLILARDVTGDEGLGRAIRDRLRRAASEHVRVD